MVWLYRPLYVVMEEVPDVATKVSSNQCIAIAVSNKGFLATDVSPRGT